MKSIFRNLICHYLWYMYQACWINPSLHLSVLQQHLVFETTTSPTQLFTVQPSFVHSWSASQDKVSSCFTSSSQSSSLHWWSPLEKNEYEICFRFHKYYKSVDRLTYTEFISFLIHIDDVVQVSLQDSEFDRQQVMSAETENLWHYLNWDLSVHGSQLSLCHKEPVFQSL